MSLKAPPIGPLLASGVLGVVLAASTCAVLNHAARTKTVTRDSPPRPFDNPSFEVALAGQTSRLEVLLNPNLAPAERNYYMNEQSRWARETALARHASFATENSRLLASSSTVSSPYA